MHSFLHVEDTLFSSILGTIALELEHEVLFLVFRREARHQPEMEKLVKRSFSTSEGGDEEGDEEDRTLELDPSIVMLARGEKIKKLIARVSEVFRPQGEKVRAHLASFRRAFCLDTDGVVSSERIKRTWHTVIPALTQVWFRCVYVFSRFPCSAGK